MAVGCVCHPLCGAEWDDAAYLGRECAVLESGQHVVCIEVGVVGDDLVSLFLAAPCSLPRCAPAVRKRRGLLSRL